MTMTTRVVSVSVPVADQDAALHFYTEVLGCEIRTDVEVWPGARMVEVVPPGSAVSLVLLPPDSQIPIAIRLGTADAQQAHAKVRESGVTLHNQDLIRMVGVPAMFSFTDPDGNGLVYLEDADESGPPVTSARLGSNSKHEGDDHG
jgi:catechol 2,3-dioxygenase-like lactoylglutathione lyase family enzyme